ncbi:MAG TPA: phosphodiester glycosidase family protein [Candidatus Udaeobacter sp.]|nr:phosphodiester glycosidase family protein [Candidatus Udaeobacter sp.]
MLFRFAFFFLVVAARAHADWTIASSTSEPGRAGIVHRHVVLENTARDERAIMDLALFSARSCTLRVLQNEGGRNSLAEVMKNENCLAGVNGGYFDEKFAPIGLRMANGQMIAPLQRARLITGVLFASPRGVQIVRSREFSRRAGTTAAIQCGPFLVDRSQPIDGLNNSRPARRTFAATVNASRALVGVCSDISLAELSRLLATTSFAEDLRIERALNLDGGSSTGFWFARESGNAFSIPEQKPVRDFVGIVPK